MTLVVLPPLTRPADWRHFYVRTRCTLCGEFALFHKDAGLPVCDGCWGPPPPPGLATETHRSDIRYHGDADGDYAR